MLCSLLLLSDTCHSVACFTGRGMPPPGMGPPGMPPGGRGMPPPGMMMRGKSQFLLVWKPESPLISDNGNDHSIDWVGEGEGMTLRIPRTHTSLFHLRFCSL